MLDDEFRDRVYQIRGDKIPPVCKSFWEYEELIRMAHEDIGSGNTGLRGEKLNNRNRIHPSRWMGGEAV